MNKQKQQFKPFGSHCHTLQPVLLSTSVLADCAKTCDLWRKSKLRSVNVDPPSASLASLAFNTNETQSRTKDGNPFQGTSVTAADHELTSAAAPCRRSADDLQKKSPAAPFNHAHNLPRTRPHPPPSLLNVQRSALLLQRLQPTAYALHHSASGLSTVEILKWPWTQPMELSPCALNYVTQINKTESSVSVWAQSASTRALLCFSTCFNTCSLQTVALYSRKKRLIKPLHSTNKQPFLG